MCVLTQLCLILCDPMDCSPPGSSVHWILEWVAFPLPEDLPNPRIEPLSPVAPVLASGFFTVKPSRSHPAPHTHRHHCSKSHLNPSISIRELFNLHAISYLLIFFPVLSLIQYSLLTKFFIWIQLILPFSVLYPEYQLACLCSVSVFIELKFLVNPDLGEPKFHLNVMHRYHILELMSFIIDFLPTCSEVKCLLSY